MSIRPELLISKFIFLMSVCFFGAAYADELSSDELSFFKNIELNRIWNQDHTISVHPKSIKSVDPIVKNQFTRSWLYATVKGKVLVLTTGFVPINREYLAEFKDAKLSQDWKYPGWWIVKSMMV